MNKNVTTIIIPCSFIPTHAYEPRCSKIDITIKSIRKQLPDAPIVITCDGLIGDDFRSYPDYAEYKRIIDTRYDNCQVICYDEHVHQSGMLPIALALTLTPLIFYLEHDWEILDPIEWEAIEDAVLTDKFNYVKLHAGKRIHPLHEHLMEDRGSINGAHFIHTRQWSQNPHLASSEFYRTAVLPRCTGKKDFIENLLHGDVGNSQWADFRCAVYNPVHGDMQRVRHLDGRAKKCE
jgi:hypothetical protein